MIELKFTASSIQDLRDHVVQAAGGFVVGRIENKIKNPNAHPTPTNESPEAMAEAVPTESRTVETSGGPGLSPSLQSTSLPPAPPKRPRGRPRKDGSPVHSATAMPSEKVEIGQGNTVSSVTQDVSPKSAGEELGLPSGNAQAAEPEKNLTHENACDALTHEKACDALTRVSAAYGFDKARECLVKFGAARVRDLDPSKYSAFVDHCDKIVAEKK